MAKKATEASKAENKAVSYEIGDRVKRVDSEGPLGTIQKVRIETVRQSIKVVGGEPLGVTITVLWDNGTKSHFVPGGIERL